MKLRSIVCALGLLAVAPATLAQSDETPLTPPQPKITAVSAMRARKAPQVTAEEIQRLKLGTVVNALARSTNQDTIGGKTDYWYRVNLPNGQTGWLFGGLLLDYSGQQRVALLRQIIEARVKAENTSFADRREIYDLAAKAVTEAKDVNTRAEFELLKLLALADCAWAFPDGGADKSPYREWLKTHAAEVIPNEFAGGYNLRSDVLWNLEAKYHTLPIADRIAWAAAENPQPSDCEGDEVCRFFVFAGEIKYLRLRPNGKHAAEALKSLNELLTDYVINEANATSGDKYAVEARTDLRNLLASLRIAAAKSSAAGKDEVLKKLARVTKL
jgi:SH3 domain-containing protein